MYLIFDTETTGLPKSWKAPHTDTDNWPRVVQLAWQLHGPKGELIKAGNKIIKPDGFTIPFNAEKVHGISTQRALDEGLPLDEVLAEFEEDMKQAEWLIGHNVKEFDVNVMGCEYVRRGIDSLIKEKGTYDTMTNTTEFVAIPGGRGGKFKFPSLTELHTKLFGEGFGDAHDAAYDVAANAKCFFGLLNEKVVEPLGGIASEEIVYEAPKLDDANFAKAKREAEAKAKAKKVIKKLDRVIPFAHTHVHSMFSILQSTSNVKKLIASAKEMGSPGIVITDLGNMMGAFQAVLQASDDFKVVIGCELFVAKERKRLQFTKDDPDRRFSQVLIAKNQDGYINLSKLSSLGFIEGYYAGFPRVDKELIEQHADNLICLTGGLSGEVPNLILNYGEDIAEEAFKWWHGIFKDDFYVTLQRHGLPEEDRVNDVLLGFAEKYGVKTVAANEAYYIKKEDADAHDVLLCVKEGEKKATPIGRGRGFRPGMPNDNFYLRTPEEMSQLFADHPEALETSTEILEKCTTPTIKRDILLPRFGMPPEFETQDDFLRHLTYEGAKTRYEAMTPEIQERIDFELQIIKQMGFPGYFLIVQDFIKAARDMGVAVGPGRGSAAGSVVAFCTGITNIDPIKYSLLFERFLNPERVSMPDIDIDFDDRGRADAINYVVEKYGKNQVAQIITYGSMAAKSSIKDAGRALDLPLPDTNALAKLVPDAPGTTLAKAFKAVPELVDIREKDQTLRGETLRLAVTLEGCMRNTGIHAAGVIIAPDDLLEYIPVSTSKDADLLVTQFDGKLVEDAGMLKMDFLGLKTLTIIKDALKLVKQNYGEDIDIDEIPLDDKKTFELYQNGDTIGTFQFESEGMRMYLKRLKPTNIEDLIAMNALYRPGPLQFIPNYIDRKHGREEVEYPHDLLKPILEPTLGIMIYQEQIMQTAQIMAGYSLGGADLLRRAMGKKKLEEMNRQEVIFIDGAKELHNIEKEKAQDVFAVMKKFAEYGFNRSHSAAYSVVAYQTGYLKANYPAEYMASVLSHSMGAIEKISFFMEECKRMGIKVLGPDVNESLADFNVNNEGAIRFGLGAIKGAGDAAVEAIIEERANGNYSDVWDFMDRVNLRTVNKKTLESLAYGGAFDGFEFHRAQYFFVDGTSTGIEKLVKFANAQQAEKASAQISLFGAGSGVDVPKPKMPDCEPWSDIVKLRYEKEVVGFYISGHPLDMFKMEIDSFCIPLSQIEEHKNKDVNLGGIITAVNIRQSKTGREFGLFTVEDYESSKGLALFGDDYLKNSHMLKVGNFVFIEGKVQEHYKEKGTWEFSPKRLMALQDVKEKKCKNITLNMPAQAISEKMIDELQSIIEANYGACTLTFNIFDMENRGTRITMSSLKYKVDPTVEVIETFKSFDQVECKVG